MKTPQQIRNEVEKGCGKVTNWYELKRLCGTFEDLKHSEHIILCPSCQAKLSILTEYDKAMKEEIKEPTGYRRGFIDGHKEAEKSIKEMIEKVLSILKEGCGVNFVLEEQDCICGDDFEYEDKVKVLLCELCLDKIKRIELLSKIGEEKQMLYSCKEVN